MEMIEISKADFQKAIRLMQIVSKCPGGTLREQEAKRMLGLMAKKWDKKPVSSDKGEVDAAVERIYSAYPTKCPVSQRSTGKSSKDKEKIARLLRSKSYTEEELAAKIDRYVRECSATRTYIKNFATFLNNVPDYSEPEQPQPVRDESACNLFTTPAWQEYLAERSKMYAER